MTKITHRAFFISVKLCDKQPIKLDIIPGICKRKVMLKKQVA